MTCKYSDKYAVLIELYKQEVTSLMDGTNELSVVEAKMTEIETVLKELFDDGEEVFKRFIREGNPIVIGGKTYADPEKERGYIREDIEPSIDTVRVEFGNESEYSASVSDFRHSVMEKCIIGFSEDYKITLPNISGAEVNNRISEVKMDLIRTVFTPDDIQQLIDNGTLTDYSVSDYLDSSVIPSDDVLSLLMRKAASVTGSMSVAKKRAVLTLKYFDDFIKDQCPFITISDRYKNRNFEGHSEKYQLKDASAHAGSGWQDKDQQAIDQVSDIATLILDFMPVLKEGAMTKNTVGKAQFLSVISTIRDWVMDGNPGYEITDLLRYWKQGGKDWNKAGTANIKKIFDAYIAAYENPRSPLDAKYKFADIDVVKSIAEYLYKANNPDSNHNEDYQKLQRIFGKMFYNVAFLHQIGYTTDNSKMLKTKELKANISDNAFRDEENVLRSRIYVERVTKHPIDQTSFTYEGFKFEKIGKQYKVTKGDKSYTIGSSTVPDFEFAVAFMEQIVGVDTTDIRNYFDSTNTFCEAVKDYIDLVTKYGIYREALDSSLFVVDSKLSPDYIKSFKLKTKYKGIRTIADAYTNIKGENSKSYVKSIDNKNNLSAYGMMNLAHRLPEIAYDMKHSTSASTQTKQLEQKLGKVGKYENPYSTNKLFASNKDKWYSSVKIRSEISVNGNTVAPTGLSTGELFKVAFKNDFLDCLNDSTNNIIRLQPITYADKSTQFVFEFNTNVKVGDGNQTIKQMLKDICKGENNKGVLKLTYAERSNRIQAIFNNVVLDYARAFSNDAEFSSECIAITKEPKGPERIDHFFKLLEKKRGARSTKAFFAEVKKAFADNNVNFSTEVHYAKGGFNATFYQQCKIFNGSGRAMSDYNAYLNTQRKRFVIDLIKENAKPEKVSITTKNGKENLYEAFNRDKSKLEDIMTDNYKVTLSGDLEAYFEANLLYGGELTSMLVGEIFVHPSKEKNVVVDDVEFELRDNSSRLIAHSKRSVIPGATMHVPVQGLPNGIAPRINVAVMEDVISLIETIDGNVTEQESMNGAGLSFRPHGKLVQNSLVDVKCGVDRKTIGHDIDPLYGKAVLLKWAEFDITNDRRRIARASNVCLESIYKKMGSHKTFLEVDANLTPEVVMNSLLSLYDNDNPIFYQDPMTLHNYKIVKGEEGFYKQRVTANGQPEENAELIPIDKTITTIYDIDQLFGGAYAMEMSPEGTLKWSEGNIDMIVNFLSKHEAAKDCYIAYAVNQSGIKVGESNVNSSNNWFNNKPLSTFSMSTEYYGLQLNAEHDVTEGGEVSEMTQMMSGLMQNGYTKDMLLEIYKDIGACAATALSKLTNALNNYTGEDNDRLHKILGRILAQSLESKTTIGLSQAFVALANKAFLEEGINVKIPYSAVTVNNNLITAIASEINRRGIKRKWAGMAGQQAPSYNMMMHYTINGKTTNYENYARECMNALRDPAHGGLTDAQFERGFRFGRGTVSTIYVPQLARVMNIEQLNEEIFSKYDVRIVIEPQDGVPSVALGEGISGTTYTIIPKNANEGADPDTVISRLTELFESSYPEAMAWCTDSMYLEEMPLFGGKHIDNYNKVDFGDVYVIDDGEKTKAVRVSSYNDYRVVRNAIMTGTAKISKLNSSPRNLNDPIIKFTVNEQVGWTKDAEGNVAAITADITYNQWDIDSVKANLALAKEIQTPEDQIVINATIARAANYYPALYNSLAKVSDPEAVKALQKKIVQKMIQHDTRAMSHPELEDAIIMVNGKEIKVNSANVSAGHIMVGRFNTAALGIPTTVDPNTITSKETFKDALKQGGSWITIQTEEEGYNDSVYDLQAVAPNGHKMAIKVVKNTEELNELLNLKSPYTNELLIHRNGNYSSIGNSLYYKEQEILTTDNFMPQMHSITDAQGVVHDMMIVVSEDPKTLSNLSNVITNAGWQSKRQNITEKNKTAFGITAPLDVARKVEANNYLSSIDRDAERKYESFKLTKKFIIARIPSQGMSSFQGAEVVLFTDNEHNEEYINQMKQCADGGDFDGDKSYGITYELINGFVETGTALQEIGLLSLEECLQLPAVKDAIIDNEDPEAYEIAITTDDALSFLAGNKLQVIKKLLTLPDNAKKIRLTYDTNNDTAKTLVNAVKTHFSTQLSVEANSAAIKNKALQKMLTITASPENYYNSTTSVDVLTKSFKAKANESELGKDKTRMSYDNPVTCLKLQSINAVGRETIGITAVSMKAFFAATSYYNGIISELEKEVTTLTSQPEIAPEERAAFTRKLKSLILDNPLRNGTETTCYANLNFNDLLYLLKQYPIDLSEEISLRYTNPFTGEVMTVISNSAEEIVEQLSFISDLNDAIGEESALLTLSTDFWGKR